MKQDKAKTTDMVRLYLNKVQGKMEINGDRSLRVAVLLGGWQEAINEFQVCISTHVAGT